MDGKDGVEAEYEGSQAFHDAWRLRSQDMLARAAFRRKKLVQRLQVRRPIVLMCNAYQHSRVCEMW